MVGFRTYLIAALTAIFGVLSVVDWNAFLHDPKAGAVMVGMSILMAVLRSITTTPPGEA